MYRFPTRVVVVVLVGLTWMQGQKTDATYLKSVGAEVSPEMQKVYDSFLGAWQVTESFEISSERRGKTRQGTASFRKAPGPSLIEEYRSAGSAGTLNAISFLWWDESAHIYRYLTCGNNDGCQLRGAVKWEGKELVNSWEEIVDGKAATFKDSFVDLSPSSFRLVSEGKADGKTIWRVITKYERLKRKP